MESIKIVYKDKNVVVLNKPAGISVHAGVGTEKTVADFVIEKFPEVKKVGEDPVRPGIVHRLDKDTSGILIIARNQISFLYLKKQFQEHRVKKTYLALVAGIVKKDRDIIARKIGRSKNDFRKRSIVGSGSREAITRYEVLKRFNDFTLLKVMPETGRQHQIRIHLKSIGCPIAGDKVYKIKRQKDILGLNRQFLHAFSLELILPSGEKKIFKAGLPKDLQSFLDKIN